MPTNPLLPYFAAGAALLSFALGWTVRDWRCDAAKLAAVQAAAVVEEKAEAAVGTAAYSYEDDRATIAQATTIERNTVREIYRDVQVPVDCAAPAAGRELLAGASQRANAAASGSLGAEVRPAP